MSQMSTLQLVLIDIGNTRTSIGTAIDGTVSAVSTVPNEQLADLTSTVIAKRNSLNADAPRPVLIASVNEPLAAQLGSALGDQFAEEVYVVGQDLPIPINCDLAPETVTGVDRLLNALAAWDVQKQACIIVDAGSAVTVDFVDGEGTFHGGAIAPGAALQLRSLHEQTDALPELTFCGPGDDAFGRSTADAMQLGVTCSIKGLVHVLVERYASHYQAFPPVIVTGGDAEVIFRNDDFVDRIVPDLTLLGMSIAARRALKASDGEPA